MVEFEDDFSFLRVVNTPSRGLGKKFIGNVAKIAEKQNISLYSALKENISQKDLSRKGATEFIELVEKYKKSKADLIISDLIKEIMDESGLSAYYRTDGDTDRLDNIKELQNSIILLETQDEESINLIEYLQEIALYTDMDIEDDRNDRVKLMTIHTSKGLEFPYVFLCGLTEGVLPSAMSIKERRAKAIEEERRLTYVAITRAEKALYMTESEGFNFSTGLNKYPSRFLFEINDKYFVRKGELSQEIINAAKEQLKLDATRQTIQKRFEVGDIVNHTIWNQGKIIEVNEEKGEYQIEFLETGKIKPINFEFGGLFGGLVKEESLKSSTNRKNKEPEKEEVENNIVEKPNTIEEVKSEEREPEIEKKIKAKIKRFAKKEYPEDKEMRDHVYKKQVEAFLYMESVTDNEIKEFAVKEYKNDYDMQQHIYDTNVAAKMYMDSVTDLEVKGIAKSDYPIDYEMQQHIYDKQVSAKKTMSEIKESPAKEYAIKEYPDDFDMQIYIYEQHEEEIENTDNETITDNLEIEQQNKDLTENQREQNSTLNNEDEKEIANSIIENPDIKGEIIDAELQTIDNVQESEIDEDKEALSPIMYKNRGGDTSKQEDTASNNLWSKLKKLWS